MNGKRTLTARDAGLLPVVPFVFTVFVRSLSSPYGKRALRSAMQIITFETDGLTVILTLNGGERGKKS